MRRLKATVGRCKIYWEAEYQEWSVSIIGGCPDSTYYTDDKQDAYDTAKWFNKRLEEN